MKNQLVHIPELHNHNYGFFDVLTGLCKANINKEFSFTDISHAWNKPKKVILLQLIYFAVVVHCFFEVYNMVQGKCFLSDMNADLVIAYNTIKGNPRELIEVLKIHKENHCEGYYYKMRALQDLQDPIENSARFIYLMKT